MTVVVSGASGLIGRAVVAELGQVGVDAVAVTRRNDVVLRASYHVKSYDELPPGDVLIHLAETSDRSEAERRGYQHLESSRVVLTRCVRRYKHVVYASSGLVYGTASRHPHEPGDHVEANGWYERSKLACEEVVRDAAGTVARLSNVFGPVLKRGTVLSDVFGQLPGDTPIVVRNLQAIRDYVWFNDVARGLVRMALARRAGTYNLSTGRGMSVASLVQVILGLAGQPGRPVREKRAGQAKAASVLVLSPRLTREAFGWTATTSTTRGLLEIFRVQCGVAS